MHLLPTYCVHSNLNSTRPDLTRPRVLCTQQPAYIHQTYITITPYQNEHTHVRTHPPPTDPSRPVASPSRLPARTSNLQTFFSSQQQSRSLHPSLPGNPFKRPRFFPHPNVFSPPSTYLPACNPVVPSPFSFLTVSELVYSTHRRMAQGGSTPFCVFDSPSLPCIYVRVRACMHVCP